MTLGVGAPPVAELDDVDRPPPPPPLDEPTPPTPPRVEEATVRGLLAGLAGATGFVIGDRDVPDHWRFSAEELDGLVPPLTRVINNRPALQALVLRGDEITVGLMLAQYAGRNVADQRRASSDRKQHQRGGAGGLGAGPDPDAARRDGGVQPAGGDGGLVPGPDGA